MEEYLRRHEAFVRGWLVSAGEGVDWAGLARFHRAQIGHLQHERLVHLLVTLFFGACTLLTLVVVVLRPEWPTAFLLLLLLALLVPYVAHYYRLENGVQRWYHLANEIESRAGNVAGRYDGAASGPPGRE